MTYDEIRAKIKRGGYGKDTPNWSGTLYQDTFRNNVKAAAGVLDRPTNDTERERYGAYISSFSLAWNIHRRDSWEQILDAFVTAMPEQD